jgi:hypothetical protein
MSFKIQAVSRAPRAVPLSAFVALSLLALPAVASVQTTYSGNGCWSDDNDPTALSANADGSLTAIRDASITCPIVKKTSGPGVTSGDTISLVEMDVTNSETDGADTACDFLVYASAYAGSASTNVVEDLSWDANWTGIASGGTDESTSQNYWNYATGKFLIPVLHCSMTAGNVFRAYTVIEDGSDTGARILSTASCSKASNMTSNYHFNPDGRGSPIEGVTDNQPAGYQEADSSFTNDTFAISCPVPVTGARNVDFALQQSTLAPVVCAGASIPAKSPATGTIITTFPASGSFGCSTSPGLGDAQLLGYRVSAATAVEKKINAGGPAVSPFAADSGATGGSLLSHANTISTAGVTNPAPVAVYQTGRLGAFTYNLTGFAPNVKYRVRLHFAETYWNATGKRVFNVKVNGTQVLTSFDIFQKAGAMNKANVQEFTTIPSSASGAYQIVFANVVDNALLNGIEILVK